MPINPLNITNGWQVLGLLIVMLPGIVAAILSLRNNNKLADVHSVINGRLTELLNVTRAAAEAEGHLEGVATEKARADAEGAAQLKAANITVVSSKEVPAVSKSE